jgi:hypothetical protein
MKSLLVVIGGAFAAITSTWPAWAAGYQFQIVDYPGAPQTAIFGINNPGMAVGYGFGFTNVTSINFQYDTKKKTFTVVPSAPGYNETDITGINNVGTMVGSVYSLNADGSRTESGVIRGKDGTFTVFRQPGWDNTEPRGINEVGLIAGFSYSADQSSWVGFIYDPRTKAFTTMLPSPITIVAGINNRGQIAGSVWLYPDAVYPGSGQGAYAFVRDADGRVTLFRVNGMPTRARGITDSGVISGFLDDPTTGYKGFVTELQGSSAYHAVSIPDSSLLVSPLQGATDGLGIANDGVVSGIAFDTIAGLEHGFIAVAK